MIPVLLTFSPARGSTAELKNVLSVETLSPLSVDLGTVFNDIGLPTSVDITFEDMSTGVADVNWTGSYDPDTADTYVLTGELVEVGFTNDDDVTASISVTVNPFGAIVLADITRVSATALDLDWDETVTGESQFEILRSVRDEQDLLEIDTVAANTEDYSDTGLYSGVYSYQVTAGAIKSNIKRILLSNFEKEYRLTNAGQEHITIPHGTNVSFDRTTPFSMAILVKFSSGAMGQVTVLASKRGAFGTGSGAGWQFFKFSDDKLQLNFIGTTQNLQLNGRVVMVADQWYYLVFTYNGNPASTKNRFYVNGKYDNIIITTNTLTSQSITNSNEVSLGTRYNTPLYRDMQIAGFWTWDRELTVNEVPDILWNRGNVRPGSAVPNCVADYRFNGDTYGGGVYTVVATVGTNGSTRNMGGDELVNMNSVMSPIPLNVKAAPRSFVENTIFWDPAGLVTYDLEVSDNGTTGWTTVATEIVDCFYRHTVGSSGTLKYYRVKSNGNGVESSYSTVVSATTLDAEYDLVNYMSTRALGDNSYNFGLSVETQRVAPQNYYDSISNKTYHVMMSRAEQGYDMVPYIRFYDHSNDHWSDWIYVGVSDRFGQDRHPMPGVIVADDGHILVGMVFFHNAPMEIWRSAEPGSLSGFTKVASLGVVTDYPELKKMTNGDLYVCFRYYALLEVPTKAGFGYFKSTDDGLTWGSLQKVLEYTYSVGRPYPTMPPQPSGDRADFVISPRNDSGGPFPSDPDKVGYFKDTGHMYTTDFITFRNSDNSFSKDVVTNGFITSNEWINNYVFNDSDGTEENGLPVSIVTAANERITIQYTDAGDYKAFFDDGTSQSLTFPDVDPDSFTFGYHGVQAIRHISGDTFDIYATKTGVVKRYRTVDLFVTLTLEEAEVLPDVGGLLYERGSMTHNIYDSPQPFVYYSIKTSEATPLPTSPGAYSDIVIKKLDA